MTARFDRFVQEGRDCFLVRYTTDAGTSLYADLVPEHLGNLAAAVEQYGTDRHREKALASVKRALSSPLPGGTLQDVADDIAIWWFYEYLDGRGEQHIVADWQKYVVPYPATISAPSWPRGLKRTPAGRKARR